MLAARGCVTPDMLLSAALPRSVDLAATMSWLAGVAAPSLYIAQPWSCAAAEVAWGPLRAAVGNADDSGMVDDEGIGADVSGSPDRSRGGGGAAAATAIAGSVTHSYAPSSDGAVPVAAAASCSSSGGLAATGGDGGVASTSATSTGPDGVVRGVLHVVHGESVDVVGAGARVFEEVREEVGDAALVEGRELVKKRRRLRAHSDDDGVVVLEGTVVAVGGTVPHTTTGGGGGGGGGSAPAAAASGSRAAPAAPLFAFPVPPPPTSPGPGEAAAVPSGVVLWHLGEAWQFPPPVLPSAPPLDVPVAVGAAFAVPPPAEPTTLAPQPAGGRGVLKRLLDRLW